MCVCVCVCVCVRASQVKVTGKIAGKFRSESVREELIIYRYNNCMCKLHYLNASYSLFTQNFAKCTSDERETSATCLSL